MNVCFTHGHRGAPAVYTLLISHDSWRVCVFWGWRVWPEKGDKRYLFFRQDFREKFSPLNASYVTHKQWQGTSDWILSVQYSRPADFLQPFLTPECWKHSTHTHMPWCALTPTHLHDVYALTHTCKLCMYWDTQCMLCMYMPDVYAMTHTHMLCTHGHTRACCGMCLPTHKHIHKISKPDVIIF